MRHGPQQQSSSGSYDLRKSTAGDADHRRIFDLCFEEFSEGSSCGSAATSVVMAFMQLAY